MDFLSLCWITELQKRRMNQGLLYGSDLANPKNFLTFMLDTPDIVHINRGDIIDDIRKKEGK